jgi:hypothetical protein
MWRYTAQGRSRRYWTIYAVTAFVAAAAWTGTALPIGPSMTGG